MKTILASSVGPRWGYLGTSSGLRTYSRHKQLDESIIKQVTGGDPVTSRFLYGEYFEYIPKWKLFVVVNHLPHINGTDRGMWRRIKVIPFNASFEAEKKDKDLLSKLNLEVPGILNWAIEGCLNWPRDGLVDPPSVVAAGEMYKLDQDSLGDFLIENTDSDINFETGASVLYMKFSDYQRETGQWVMSQKLFSQKLLIKGYKKKRGDKGRVVYLGLRLKDSFSGIC